ncbi:hypothetical protein [Tsukamurella sp. 1534]|uniref:hypothetical protein n=1 Tax=Tsukamurella sp. 1534 TaxID=1151061 RepID=UPI0006885135|nr:hypothetical protein [Tsukamurella sp. 1534]
MTGPAATRAVAAVARTALGALWIHEAYLKYHAGFGRSDILLVAQSATANPRVPGPFRWFATEVMGAAPGAFGVLVPLTEAALGAGALLGVLPRATALAAALLLCSYWLADQLVVQYPVMVALAAVVLAAGTSAGAWSPAAALFTCRGRGRAPSPSA